MKARWMVGLVDLDVVSLRQRCWGWLLCYCSSLKKATVLRMHGSILGRFFRIAVHWGIAVSRTSKTIPTSETLVKSH